jgi:hypothetical protein
MARPIKVSEKIKDLESLLNAYSSLATSEYAPDGQRWKEVCFDLIFSLSKEEQAQLFAHRAKKDAAAKSIRAKFDMDELEKLAQQTTGKRLIELEIEALKQNADFYTGKIDTIKRVDTGKMVGDYLDGGQNHQSGAKIKRHLDQLLNLDVSDRVKVKK